MRIASSRIVLTLTLFAACSAPEGPFGELEVAHTAYMIPGDSVIQRDDEFVAEWKGFVGDLLTFQLSASEPKPDAKSLAKLRDQLRKRHASFRPKARTSEQKSFLDLADTHFTQLLDQLDETVRVAKEGKPKKVEEAAWVLGFILEEMNAYVRAAQKKRED